MKKILYILSIALLGAVACNKQSFEPEFRKSADPLPEGTKMELRFSLADGEARTRGEMTDKPNITPTGSELYVFVFNANSGMLLEVAKATMENPVTDNTPWDVSSEEQLDLYNTDFSAMVSTGSAPRHMHFIVDPPTYETDGSNQSETGIGYADDPIYLGESEANIVAKLYNTDKKTSYWQRVHLPNGLTAYTYPGGKPEMGVENTDWHYTPDATQDLEDDTYTDANGNTVYFGDYVNGNGHKITDGTGYICSSEVSALLKHIPTIRNFVKIQVSKATGGTFTPSKAVLLNTPVSGYIAPYSPASGFVSYYQYGDEGKIQYLKPLAPDDPKYDPTAVYGSPGVESTGYTAPVPFNEIDTACPEESACVSASNGIIDLFMYERGKPTANPTQLLVYGKFDDEANSTWLKIDITNEDGNYIPLFREFTYEMKIGAITGTKGYETMKGAYDGPSIGNPSSSPETATLNQVTDGKGVGIWVDFIDYASFDPAGESVTLRYKFWDNTGVKSSSAELTVSHTTTTGAITTTTLAGSSYSGTDTQDSQNGWYVVTVPLQPQGSTVYKSVLRVSGTGTNNQGKTVTLYRDITFSVMPTQTFTAVMSKLEADAYDKTTTATITLPDGLGYSIFPLVIRIEAYKGSINPTDSDLPVDYGTSTFSVLETEDDLYRDIKFYWFNKTIDYNAYAAGTRTFTANFKTILNTDLAVNTNVTTVLFSDTKGHFYPVKASLAVNN